MMSFWVYILECSDGSYYTGHTDNLEKRLAAHNQKAFKCYTSSRLPIKLVFCSEFKTRNEAFASERQIKGWSRYKKQALIEQDWEKLANYSSKNRPDPSTSSG
jgi:predicted GIY-YIG superfamily endonuclease